MQADSGEWIVSTEDDRARLRQIHEALVGDPLRVDGDKGLVGDVRDLKSRVGAVERRVEQVEERHEEHAQRVDERITILGAHAAMAREREAPPRPTTGKVQRIDPEPAEPEALDAPPAPPADELARDLHDLERGATAASKLGARAAAVARKHGPRLVTIGGALSIAWHFLGDYLRAFAAALKAAWPK